MEGKCFGAGWVGGLGGSLPSGFGGLRPIGHSDRLYQKGGLALVSAVFHQ
jgi:hypothetical protein